MNQLDETWKSIPYANLLRAAGYDPDDHELGVKEVDRRERDTDRYLCRELGCTRARLELSNRFVNGQFLVLYRCNDDLPRQRRNKRQRWNRQQAKWSRENLALHRLFSPRPTRECPPIPKDHSIRKHFAQKLEEGGRVKVISMRGELWPDKKGHLVVRGDGPGIVHYRNLGFSGRIVIRKQWSREESRKRGNRSKKYEALAILTPEHPQYASLMAYACYSFECPPEEIELRGRFDEDGSSQVQTRWLKSPKQRNKQPVGK